MVTARNDTHDVVAGLEAGADDYLTKPFAPKELSARIRALLRRVRPVAPGHERLVFGDLELIPEEGKVLRGGAEVHLTKTEFRLLCELAENRGKVFSREELLDKVWGYDYFGDGRLVDVHIRRLRTKVEADAGRPAPRRHRARARLPAGVTGERADDHDTAARRRRARARPRRPPTRARRPLTTRTRRRRCRATTGPRRRRIGAPPPAPDRAGGVGLRRRILLIFTLGSLTLSAFLAVTTYGLVRSNLIEQRYAASRQAAYADAQHRAARAARPARRRSPAASEQLQHARACSAR